MTTFNFSCIILMLLALKGSVSSLKLDAKNINGEYRPMTNGNKCVRALCKRYPTNGIIQINGIPVCVEKSVYIDVTFEKGYTFTKDTTSQFSVTITTYKDCTTATKGLKNFKVVTGPKCDVISGVTGLFKSPSYPDASTEKAECTFNFPAKVDYKAVQLTFASFNLEKTAGCATEYLQVAGTKYCAEKLKSKTLTLFLPTSVVYRTSNGVKTSEGFSSSYKYIKDTKDVCMKNFTSTTSSIVLPITGKKYKNDLNCIFSIQKGASGACVTFSFDKFNLGDGDVLTIGKNEIAANPTAEVTERFEDGATSMPILFTSDNVATNTMDNMYYIAYDVLQNAADCPKVQCKVDKTEILPTLSLFKLKNNLQKTSCIFTIPALEMSKKGTLKLLQVLATGDTVKYFLANDKTNKIGVTQTGVDITTVGQVITVEYESTGTAESIVKISYVIA